MKRKSIKWYFVRWITCWASLIDGIIGVLLFGFLLPDFLLKSIAWFMDVEDECINNNH